MSEQLRVQIAEWCGFTHIQRAGSRRLVGFLPDHKGATELPDFTGDLNAIASAEAKLSSNQKHDYANVLANICMAENDGPHSAIMKSLFATALQRATALGRVINQERE